jgi:hypothetical protein
MKKVPSWAWVILAGALLYLPRLGAHGLWDPYEVRLADVAREVADGKGNSAAGKPLLSVLASALGVELSGDTPHSTAWRRAFLFLLGAALAGLALLRRRRDRAAGQTVSVATQILGALAAAAGLLELALLLPHGDRLGDLLLGGETGLRLPHALFGVVGLWAAWYAANGLFSARAGLIAAFVLAVSPLYLLSSRSLIGDVEATAALTLALGGWGRFLLGGGKADFAAGMVGVALGTLGAGGLLGALGPAAALGLCAALAAFAPGAREVRQQQATRAGWATLGAFAGGWVALALTLAIRWMLHQRGATQTALALADFWLGGPLRHGPAQTTFEEAIRAVGFGFFPASVAAPLAMGACLATRPVDAAEPAGALQHRFTRLYAVGFAAALLAAYAVVLDRTTVDLRFPGLGALAVLVGAFFDDLLGEGEPHPLLGAALAVGILLLARDFFLFPEDWAAANVRESLRWPAELKPGRALLALSTLTAGALGVALVLRDRARRQVLLGAALGATGLAALYNGQLVMPGLSQHVSFKLLFDRYHKLARSGEPLRSYHVSGQGMSYYAGGKLEDMQSSTDLLSYLRAGRGTCVYALVPNDELGALDQQIRGAGVTYYVVDVSSSRFLLVSSCLVPGEHDQNPLRTFVRSQPPDPPPARTLHANWDNKIELIGLDVPLSVSRVTDGKITITLHYKVLDRVPPNYKVFLHFDGCSNRFNGDHVPLDGKFPTQYWSPGDYISDRTVVPVPLMTTPACTYQMFVGFFLGDTRLQVEPGSPAEPGGTNRVPLGVITVR